MVGEGLAPSRYYYHFDRLGSVNAITDDSGAVVEKYQYDAYGKTIAKDALGNVLPVSSVGNRFGFTARELDSETGLYFYRNRYYSPVLGRFLQTDPVGYYDSMNLYTYVGNRPNSLVDPYGLWTIQIGVSGSGGLGGGLTKGTGVVFGYGKEKGFQFGTYSVGGGGAFAGKSGSGVVDITWSKNPNIKDLEGVSTTAGGSGQIAASPSIGGEANYSWDKKKTSYTGSIGLGVGTPEGHIFLTETEINVKWTSRKNKCETR